jgi:hypothetical protein
MNDFFGSRRPAYTESNFGGPAQIATELHTGAPAETFKITLESTGATGATVCTGMSAATCVTDHPWRFRKPFPHAHGRAARTVVGPVGAGKKV